MEPAAGRGGGDPERAFSGLRNLYAGMLLLFKYRFAMCTETDAGARELIFDCQRIEPRPDGRGGVTWKPQRLKRTTIDFADIQKRFEAFNILVDWGAIERLRDERNSVEHLHAENAPATIARFLADLFPVLRQFIEAELEEVPATLLGATWNRMLAHHAFFADQLKECIELWEEFGVPKQIKNIVESTRCGRYGSSLIHPTPDGDQCHCRACGKDVELFPFLERELVDWQGGYDPYGGDQPPTRTCPECQHRTFVVEAGECYWCGHELFYTECGMCTEPLTLDDQGNGGKCLRCASLLARGD